MRTWLIVVPCVLSALLLGAGAGYLLAPGGGEDGAHAADGPDHAGTEEIWTCSMHPQIQQPDPGLCPICNMELIPLVEEAGAAEQDVPVLTLSAAAMELAEIRTVPVDRRYVDHRLRLSGTVDHDEQGLQTISAWIPGRIERLFADYTGMRVTAGDHLFELYSPELITAGEELVQAARMVEETDDASTFLHRSNRRALQAARDKLRLWGLTTEQVEHIETTSEVADRMTIYAPAGGTVTARHVSEGGYVQTGSPVLTISDLTTVWVHLDVYEHDLPFLRHRQEVTIVPEALPGRQLSGRVAFIQPELDERTRTVPVRVNIANPDRDLRPGMFVRAEVRVRLGAGGVVLGEDLTGKWISPMHPEVVKDEPGTCDICGMDLVEAAELGLAGDTDAGPPLVVPASAVLRTGERAVVYVRPDGAEPTFVGREIELGLRADDHYLVNAGLKEGELVVTHGAFKIDADLQIRAKPSMMDPAEEEPMATQTSGATRADPALGAALTPLYTAYLAAARALAADDPAAARDAFADLDAARSDIDADAFSDAAALLLDAQLEALAEPLASAEAAEDLADRRLVLRDLTGPILRLLEAFGHAGERSIARAHCPMAFDNAGADWLQTGDQVANPYYGASMLRCGSLEESFPGEDDDRE